MAEATTSTPSGADREDPPAAAVAVGSAVHFRFRDSVFGTELEQAGIVVSTDGETVAVAPVQPFTVHAAAGDVTPLVPGA